MSLSNFRQELRQIEGIARVAELADGLSMVDGSETILLVHGRSQHKNNQSEDQLRMIEQEFDQSDYVLVAVEGAVLLLEGTLDEFEVSYLPDYLGGIAFEGLRSVVENFVQGTIEREPLRMDYLSKDERYNVIELFEDVLAANLTTYYTPQEVARISANWVTAGERTSVLDVACGSGELFTAALNSVGKPEYALGIDQNGLACAITETRVREQRIKNWEICSENFFSLLDEISSDQQQSLDEYSSPAEGTSFFPEGGFDCVIAHPPAGRSSQRNTVPDTSSTKSYPRIEHQFVNSACQLLSDSGRGCFVLPSHSVRNLRDRVLPDSVELRRLVKLPEMVFPIVGVEPVLAFVERTSDNSELGILNVGSFDNLNRICGAVHSTTAAENVDNVEAVSVQSDIPMTTIRTLLDAPAAAPFFTGDLPTLEDVTERIATGMTTGHNRGFYFDEEQREESEIHDRFFTPVIKSVPEEGPITDEQIDCYLFDLREFVADNDLDPRDFEGIQRTLSSVDPQAATHVEEEITPIVRERSGLNGVLPRSIPLTNPDLVTGAITSDVRWLRVEVDSENVLYDTQVVGISCRKESNVVSIQTLLNTPLYRRLNETQFPKLDADYVRVQIRPLQRLPFFYGQLNEEAFTRIESLSPYDSQESRETARTIILECVDSPYRAAVSETYDAVSPLSTLNGYETKIDQLRSALGHVSEQSEFDPDLVDEGMIAQLEDTFGSAELFTSREQLVAELLTVYSEERYWSFLGGTVSQFEGMLQDYVESTGGQVEPRETEEGNTRLEYRYGSDGWKPLRLKILLDDFFSGDLLKVMQNVRKQRNEIAHGRLLKQPELNADIILLSFFVFTYALLTEYNQYLGAESASR